eukprot:gene571-biopygen9156
MMVPPKPFKHLYTVSLWSNVSRTHSTAWYHMFITVNHDGDDAIGGCFDRHTLPLVEGWLLAKWRGMLPKVDVTKYAIKVDTTVEFKEYNPDSYYT